MDLSEQRLRMLKRAAFIVVGVALLAGLAGVSLFAAVRYREWHEAREQSHRLALATSVKAGNTRAQVEQILGEPMFMETNISDMFTPNDAMCRRRSRSSFIYQAMPEQTLVVFFDEQSRVTCVETTTAFMIMHRMT